MKSECEVSERLGWEGGRGGRVVVVLAAAAGWGAHALIGKAERPANQI